MDFTFRAVAEAQPGPKWASLFSGFWPAYRRWWARESTLARPTYRACLTALETYMPELVPLYHRLCRLAGGGDEAARFLSFYGPPPYLSGCSQAIWPGAEPLMVRNYDYSPHAFDGVLLRTEWLGRPVMGMSDGLWGLVDGINGAGLSVSLTFGGRREVGPGFGVPIVLRYILETCDTAEEAARVLARVPSHMSYNITVVDRDRHYLTAMVAPDRPTVLTHAAVATNHQERVEWATHARLTATVERERFLLHRLTLHEEPEEKFVGAFLKPPLYSIGFGHGFGTLYTAAYRPRVPGLSLHWPGHARHFPLADFRESRFDVRYPDSVAHGVGTV